VRRWRQRASAADAHGEQETTNQRKLSVSGVRAVNFLIVYAQAETGEDVPRKRPGRLARRLLLAIVVGAAAGMAVMLGIDGWGR
jgi:hypothetical protein